MPHRLPNALNPLHGPPRQRPVPQIPQRLHQLRRPRRANHTAIPALPPQRTMIAHPAIRQRRPADAGLGRDGAPLGQRADHGRLAVQRAVHGAQRVVSRPAAGARAGAGEQRHVFDEEAAG